MSSHFTFFTRRTALSNITFYDDRNSLLSMLSKTVATSHIWPENRTLNVASAKYKTYIF